MTALTDRALALAAQGYAAFPLTGKAPLPGSRGYKEASLDPEVIARMDWSKANAIGIATGGEARLLVIDVDADPTGRTPMIGSLAIQALRGIPFTTQTRMVRTPRGGAHFYVRLAPDDLPLPTSRADVVDSKAKDGTALDVRCAGGYVVAYDPAPGREFPASALPAVPRQVLTSAGILPASRPAKLAAAQQTGQAGRMGLRNSLAQWAEVAERAVGVGGIPLNGNDAFLAFTGALASAVRDEGHPLREVLEIFHHIAGRFPNYSAEREEARFVSFLKGDYIGPRPGFGTLAFHAENARIASLRTLPVTPAVPARGMI